MRLCRWAESSHIFEYSDHRDWVNVMTCFGGLTFREKLEDFFKIKRERCKGFHKYVKEFHKRKERIHREKIDRIQREKILLLKSNDVEGYLRMVQVLYWVSHVVILDRMTFCPYLSIPFRSARNRLECSRIGLWWSGMPRTKRNAHARLKSFKLEMIKIR